jgi:PAS domain S-box-containing protein
MTGLPAEAVDASLYQRLVESSPDGIILTAGTRIVFANPAAVRLFGAAHAGEIVGRTPFDLFHPDSHAVIADRIQRMRQGEPLPPVEEKIVRLDDGRAADVEANATLFGDDGTIQVVIRDITERKAHEAVLKANEERLTLAFAGAQEGVWDWDLATSSVVYSIRWKQMLGYADDEIVANVHAWERLLHPDDAARALALLSEVQHGAEIYQGEFRLQHKAGHYITVLTRGLPIRSPQDGRVVRIVGTHLDVTEQKRTELALRESEERLRLAFAGAQEGIWDWDLQTNACVYSSRWKQMLGYADDEIEPHISAWERLVHPDDRLAADRAHQSVTEGQPTYEAEFRLRHKAGHYVHVLSRGFPVRRDPSGPVLRIVGTHFDLTERRKREQERARTELLAHLVFVQEDERRRIARDMHDQFGEHLTALSLRIALLKQACAGRPELTVHAAALETIGQDLDNDVEQLVWQLRPTALDDLGLQAALQNYLGEWTRRTGIAAELHTSGLLDRRLASEVETALYRIAQEALNNIAKHSRASRVEVVLEKRADYISLIVEDDGVGFEPAAAAAGAHGFGLVGMQERATLVGASLAIESTPGQGTTILVRMAVSAAPAGDE